MHLTQALGTSVRLSRQPPAHSRRRIWPLDIHEDSKEMGWRGFCCSCFMEALLLSSADLIQEKENHPLRMGGKHLLWGDNPPPSPLVHEDPLPSSAPLNSPYAPQLYSPVSPWWHETKLINVGKPCGNVWLAKCSR